VPADGQPIILLTEYPTIGGYPKIANIISADYDSLVQKIPGTNIKFKCIELKEAEIAFKVYTEKTSQLIKDISIVK
jgi:antagonist of KipI